MYWQKQEKIVFGIVVFLALIIQLSSIYLLKNSTMNVRFVLLVSKDIAIFLGLILYAKWLWKSISYSQIGLRILFFEVMFWLIILVFMWMLKLL